MKKTLITVLLIIVAVIPIKEENLQIPKDTIRFRIIANSNNEKDQILKKEIMNKLIPELKKTISYNSIDEVRNSIKKNMDLYTNIVEKTIKENNSDTSFHINYGKNYFPKKTYNNKTYKAGNYESLVITLGKAKGKNFWCVLFPPLCLVDKDNKTQYKSYLKEIINKYF